MQFYNNYRIETINYYEKEVKKIYVRKYLNLYLENRRRRHQRLEHEQKIINFNNKIQAR